LGAAVVIALNRQEMATVKLADGSVRDVEQLGLFEVIADMLQAHGHAAFAKAHWRIKRRGNAPRGG
jgi:hypothetical protein